MGHSVASTHTMTRRETHGGGPLFESGHTLQNKCSPNNVVCIKLLGDGIRKCVPGLISPFNLTHIVHTDIQDVVECYIFADVRFISASGQCPQF